MSAEIGSHFFGSREINSELLNILKYFSIED